MAVLNVTPDSFHEASRVPTVDAALRAAARAIEHGADMLDIGGESTRPGAGRVSDADQIARVAPVVRAIRNELGGVPISVDTTRSAVAAAAIDNGADAINDVSGATQDAGMLGLGFGKAVEQNMELVRRSGELASLGYPLLCAASRKSFVGAVSIGAESSPSDRLAGSIAMSVVHRMLGASIFRVHDPREQAQALRVVWALEEAGGFSWPRVPA